MFLYPNRTSTTGNLLRLAIACLVVLGSAPLTRAENIDLSTVPTRNSVQLTIYNSEDITLVRETRTITVKKGANPLQFSWAGTLIDASSVQLKFLTQPEKLEVLDTTFPQAKPQMLYWNVSSEFDGETQIEITYFTSGITWSADYQCITNRDETKMQVDGFVRIVNNSGEEYEDAQVRLVVGKINLVEKIAQLANVSLDEAKKLDGERDSKERGEALRSTMNRRMFLGRGMGGVGGPEGAGAEQEKQIIKEGLSEYFIFTIEGTETIPNGWSKRMRSLNAEEVPVEVQYRYRPQEYGEQLVRMYLWKNDEKSKLGTSPLPDGIVRLFRDNAKEGLTYLTQQPIKYVPIGDKIELNLGADPEVIFELIKLRSFRNNLWLQINGTNEFRQIGGDGVKKEENASIVGWDDHEIFTQRIRNYTAKPISVEIRRQFAGHIGFRSQLEPKLHDYQTVELKTAVPAGKRVDLKFEIDRKQGRNSMQNNITLQPAEVQ